MENTHTAINTLKLHDGARLKLLWAPNETPNSFIFYTIPKAYLPSKDFACNYRGSKEVCVGGCPLTEPYGPNTQLSIATAQDFSMQHYF